MRRNDSTFFLENTELNLELPDFCSKVSTRKGIWKPTFQPQFLSLSHFFVKVVYVDVCGCVFQLVALPKTNILAPENGWLEYDRFLLSFGPFSGANC